MKIHFQSTVAGALAILIGGFLGSCTSPAKPSTVKNPEAHKQFQSLDTNKDGKLSYAELLKTKMARKSSDSRQLFDQMDTSRDGYISIPEWRNYKVDHKKTN